jgi:hypothetical protein
MPDLAKAFMADLKLPETVADPIRQQKWYRFGIKASCPREVTLGGVHFPRRTERVIHDGVDTRRTRIVGDVAPFDDEQIEAIKKAALGRVIRRRMVLPINGKNFNHQRGDLPLVAHIYLIPIGAMELAMYLEEDPESMLQAAEAAEALTAEAEPVEITEAEASVQLLGVAKEKKGKKRS